MKKKIQVAKTFNVENAELAKQVIRLNRWYAFVSEAIDVELRYQFSENCVHTPKRRKTHSEGVQNDFYYFSTHIYSCTLC